MYEVTVEDTFAAGHALRGYKGKCENVHGHNYRVQVTVQGTELDSTGLLVDFVELKRVMRDVIARLDHQFVNDLEPFTVINPSAENMAKYFYDHIAGSLRPETPLRISQVKLWETDTSSATYRE
jgi:6-pyruvoyltetrahydropterin/6-carboxytetrahydropterin synthase